MKGGARAVYNIVVSRCIRSERRIRGLENALKKQRVYANALSRQSADFLASVTVSDVDYSDLFGSLLSKHGQQGKHRVTTKKIENFCASILER